MATLSEDVGDMLKWGAELVHVVLHDLASFDGCTGIADH